MASWPFQTSPQSSQVLGPHRSLLPLPSFHFPSLSNHVCCALFTGLQAFPTLFPLLGMAFSLFLCLKKSPLPFQTQLNGACSVKPPWISQGGLGAACLGSQVLCEGGDWMCDPSTQDGAWHGRVSEKGRGTIWMLGLGSLGLRDPQWPSGYLPRGLEQSLPIIGSQH